MNFKKKGIYKVHGKGTFVSPKRMNQDLISFYSFTEECFMPILTNKLESVYLDIKEGSPRLKIERFTYENSNIIEYTVSLARGDKFKYRVKLNNN